MKLIGTLFVCMFLAQDVLDLPVADPTKKTQTQAPPPPPPEPEDTDPDDGFEPPIVYGEALVLEKASIVFVIDRSGSMGGERLNKAKAELTKTLTDLDEAFEFSIVSYACDVDSFSPVLVKANEANKAAAIQWVQALRAFGGTTTGPAGAAGLKFQSDKAIILTDGAPNCGAEVFDGHRAMIRNANTGTSVDVFGIAATGQFKAFCRIVALENGGSFYDVP